MADGARPALPAPASPVSRVVWRAGSAAPGAREVAEETPVALSYNNATHAVMMATPRDLVDFGIGFSLSEGIVSAADEIADIEVMPLDAGADVRIWLRDSAADALHTRRRRVLGASGCGMCGMESLAEANRSMPRVPEGQRFAPEVVARAMASLAPAQALNAATHAVHAAGFWQEGAPLLLREDVGRHNALDKLIGAMARDRRDAASGIVVLSSRVSVEMVQKAAMLGAPVLAAVSAPTALGIRTAEAAGMTLIGVARADGFELFCGARRIEGWDDVG